ncbi:Crp/Fnr family transcriptional regulator [uncultured Mucilaginibacter sp.]|uniref:Crp/Fnr family transcriptional regulator n=1 Tax=uncultured Mucilaginibacter sp. TaxID=797541 RepID=UPI0025EEB17F|nr:Crp/Fnr family transcriptional regulator [uncultured Mucilaginibacter sp.]
MPGPEFELLSKHILKRVQLADEELNFMLSQFKLTRIKKRQFIVQPGFTAKHRNFVYSGAFRAYVVIDNGEDHTIQFAIEDWWITDYNSYYNSEPATLFVMALEDSVILQLSRENEDMLKQANHKYETFFRISAERAQAFHFRQLITNLTQPAEYRYENFLEKYPLIANRVPQYALASYLGMTTEYLSKLRNKRTAK